MWTPGTLRSTAIQVTDQLNRFAEVNTELAMASEAEKTELECMMELMLQMRADDRKLREEKREREERQRETDRLDRMARIDAQERQREADSEREALEREDRRVERETRREEEREAREVRLLATLKAAQLVVPKKVNMSKLNLPKMTNKDDPVVFIRYLETALIKAKVPPEQWKDHVQPQITLQVGERVIDVLERKDCTFEEIKAAPTGIDAMSFASTAEAIFYLFKGGEKLKLRLLAERMKGWGKKLIQEAKTEADIIEKFTFACLRSTLSQDLKDYLDFTETSTLQRYLVKIEEWEMCRAEGRQIYRQDSQNRSTLKSSSTVLGFQKRVTCFHRGKVGHVSRECRARLAKESLTPTSQTQLTSPTPNPLTAPKPERKPIVCFMCHKQGHKSPQPKEGNYNGKAYPDTHQQGQTP